MTLGWLFVASAAVVVFYPLFLPLVTFDPLVNALPAGVLVALGAQLLAQGTKIGEANEKRSLFYLDSCVEAYQQARNLLIDGNNDRATWIGAGRALTHAKELATNITEDAHLRVLELHRLTYRNFFAELLAEAPAAFFYGAEDPSVCVDQAAKSSTAGEERGGRHITSTVRALSETSLRAVWEAAQWPSDYTDPLDRNFSPDERGKLTCLYPGLYEYLEHQQRWISASGKLFQRHDSNDC